MPEEGEAAQGARPTRSAQMAHLNKLKNRHQRNEKLEERALIDPLTGLYNRRFLLGDPDLKQVGLLESAFKGAQRGNDPLSLVMIDLDNFKTKVNDKYGHLAGDKVLSRMGETIKTLIRRSDFGIRYGGEEFLLVLPATDTRGAENIAELIRETVSLWAFEEENMPEKTTVSVGVASYIPGKSDSIKDENVLIYAADKAMYYAKDEGRNQIWVAGEEARPIDQVEKYGLTKLTYHKSTYTKSQLEG